MDSGEDGTGRGTPLVAFHPRQDPDVSGDVTHPLGQKDTGHAIAFTQEQEPKWENGEETAHTLGTYNGRKQAVAFAQNQRGELRTSDIAPQLTTGGGKPWEGYSAVATLAVRGRGEGRNLEIRQDGTANAVLTPNGGRDGIGVGAIAAPTLTHTNDPSRSPQSSEITQQVDAVVQSTLQVRRLMPVECELLQGFPRYYTRIPWKHKPPSQCPDGPRYKALGNSMAVNCMRWLGERIEMVEEILEEAD
jgi:DNA (cytosine-5)-methyltransferase 1